MDNEKLVAELREPNPPRGTAALMAIAADQLEAFELKVLRLEKRIQDEAIGGE